MIREVLARSPALAVPLGTLFLFLTVFLGAVVRAYGRRGPVFDAAARLPLSDGEPARDGKDEGDEGESR